MIQLSPTDLEHYISFIARYKPTIDLDVALYNEASQIETIVESKFSTVDGLTTVSFDFNFVENDKYQIKITDCDGIMFRGKIIASSQTPQEFKQTKDLYYYE